MTIVAAGQPSIDRSDILMIDAWGPNGDYRTGNREVIKDTAGVTVAELSIVPPLYINRTISAQHKTLPSCRSLIAEPRSLRPLRSSRTPRSPGWTSIHMSHWRRASRDFRSPSPEPEHSTSPPH